MGKSKRKVITVHDMKAYGRVEV